MGLTKYVPAILFLFASSTFGCSCKDGPNPGPGDGSVPSDLDSGISTEPKDLCQGLTPNDTANHPRPALTRPAIGASVVDPVFGTKIVRIADGRVPMYSTVSAFNANESRLLLYQPGGGHRLHDGRTYVAIRDVDIAPNDLEQVYWHVSDPDVLFYTEGRELKRYRVSTDASEVVRNFAFCGGNDVGAGGDPFFTSFDSRLIGLKCGNQHFLYDIVDDVVTGMTTSSRDLAPQAAPSGMRAYFEGDVVRRDLSLERTLALDSPLEHASMGRTPSGVDTYLSVVFDGAPTGTLVAFDMTTGTPRVVIGEDTGYPYPPGGTHVSGLAYRNPGWAFVSIVGDGDGQSLLDGELVLANFATGDVCRFAHHRSSGSPYFAEPHVVPSPTGTRAVFGSDWGGSIGAYVVELPAYTP